MNQSTPRERNWVGTLRRACLALQRTSSEIIQSVWVVLPGPSDPDQASLLGELSSRLCQEYGLVASVQREGQTLAVRIRRRAAWQEAGDYRPPRSLADQAAADETASQSSAPPSSVERRR